MGGGGIILALSPSPPDARTRGDGTAADHVGIGLAWFSFSDGTSIRNTAARLPPNARGGVLLGRLTPSGRCVYLADERGLHRAHGASRAASRLLADRKRRTRTTSTGAHYHRALTSTRKDSHVSPAGDSRLREDLLEDYYEMCSLLIGAQEQRVLPPDRLVSGHRSMHHVALADASPPRLRQGREEREPPSDTRSPRPRRYECPHHHHHHHHHRRRHHQHRNRNETPATSPSPPAAIAICTTREGDRVLCTASALSPGRHGAHEPFDLVAQDLGRLVRAVLTVLAFTSTPALRSRRTSSTSSRSPAGHPSRRQHLRPSEGLGG